METNKYDTQYLIKNNLMRYVFIKILIFWRNLLMYQYSSNEYLYIRKSNLNFKNTSENARGRGINTDNSPTETHPPL